MVTFFRGLGPVGYVLTHHDLRAQVGRTLLVLLVRQDAPYYYSIIPTRTRRSLIFSSGSNLANVFRMAGLRNDNSWAKAE